MGIESNCRRVKAKAGKVTPETTSSPLELGLGSAARESVKKYSSTYMY